MIKNAALLIFGTLVAVLLATVIWAGWFKLVDSIIDLNAAGATESTHTDTEILPLPRPIVRPITPNSSPVRLDLLGWDVTYLTHVDPGVASNLATTLVEIDQAIRPDLGSNARVVTVFDNANQDPYRLSPETWNYDLTSCESCDYGWTEIGGMANGSGEMILDDTSLYGYHGTVAHEATHWLHFWLLENDPWAAAELEALYADAPSFIDEQYAGENEWEMFAEAGRNWMGCENHEDTFINYAEAWPEMADFLSRYITPTQLTHC